MSPTDHRDVPVDGQAGSVDLTARLLRDWPLPEPGGSKYQRGQVVVVGGAERTPGAVRLSGEASLRVGAGRLQLAVAAPVAPAMAVATPEAGVAGLDVSHGSILPSGIAAIADWLEAADVVILGPGLDDPDLTRGVVSAVLAAVGPHTRLVLDAFALGALPELPDLDPDLAARTVLTPNDSEAERLLGRPVDDTARDVVAIATRYQTVVACGGIVATPDARTWRVGIGHSGLATSGSGDVMAGALGGLLARGADPDQAACWATYLHAAAGERLASSVGRVGFLAREIPTRFPPLLLELA